eukprot:ctg_630.g260
MRSWLPRLVARRLPCREMSSMTLREVDVTRIPEPLPKSVHDRLHNILRLDERAVRSGRAETPLTLFERPVDQQLDEWLQRQLTADADGRRGCPGCCCWASRATGAPSRYCKRWNGRAAAAGWRCTCRKRAGAGDPALLRPADAGAGAGAVFSHCARRHPARAAVCAAGRAACPHLHRRARRGRYRARMSDARLWDAAAAGGHALIVRAGATDRRVSTGDADDRHPVSLAVASTAARATGAGTGGRRRVELSEQCDRLWPSHPDGSLGACSGTAQRPSAQRLERVRPLGGAYGARVGAVR